MSKRILQSLNPFIQTLNAMVDINAVLCYGSYAEGTYDNKSDIDLFVICEKEIPPIQVRKNSYEQQGASQIVMGKSHDNWETSWTPINDELVLNAKKIEIGYNTSEWVEEVVTEIVTEGNITLPHFQFRPYTFLALLENSICLFDKDSFLTHLRKNIRPYPAKLKTAIIMANLPIFNESLVELEDFSQRNIGLLAFQFMLFRALDAAIQIIFAINEVYYPASKREEKHLLRLAKLPASLNGLILDLLPIFYTKQNEIIDCLKDIKLFIGGQA